jgi:hypothetical protein
MLLSPRTFRRAMPPLNTCHSGFDIHDKKSIVLMIKLPSRQRKDKIKKGDWF